MRIKRDIRKLSLDEIKEFILEIKDKPFRAKQIYEWIWVKWVDSFDEMTNLSKDLRDALDKHFVIAKAKIKYIQKSKDGTIKSAFSMSDDLVVEGVLIPSRERITACVSSQVGCNFECRFCATGALNFKRNLTPNEIYDQVFHIKKQAEDEHNSALSNIVFMGMGEPLMNYDNVLSAINKITSNDGLGMSPSRITVSTVGIARRIKQLGDDNVKFNLALSLHSANDAKRSSIMDINKSNPLSKLTEALVYFNEKTNSRITFEYLMLKDFNDRIQDAKELAEFCKSFPCKINLIEYNEVKQGVYRKSTDDNTNDFLEFMRSKNLIVNVRRSKGSDIAAACGQLAAANVKK